MLMAVGSGGIWLSFPHSLHFLPSFLLSFIHSPVGGRSGASRTARGIEPHFPPEPYRELPTAPNAGSVVTVIKKRPLVLLPGPGETGARGGNIEVGGGESPKLPKRRPFQSYCAALS